jgi:dTDP-4-amino-4,6-dideoxygalactose transaminase
MSYGRHVFHLFVIRTADRDTLRDQFREAEIECGLHYPIPLHLQQAYCHLGYRKGSLPVTERVKDEILSLPIYPGISTGSIERVASIIVDMTELQERCNVA